MRAQYYMLMTWRVPLHSMVPATRTTLSDSELPTSECTTCQGMCPCGDNVYGMPVRKGLKGQCCPVLGPDVYLRLSPLCHVIWTNKALAVLQA